MKSVTLCPSCGQKFSVPDTAVGKQAKCLKCQASFRVSAAGQEKQPAPKSDEPDLSVAAEAFWLEDIDRQVGNPPQAHDRATPPEPDSLPEAYNLMADSRSERDHRPQVEPRFMKRDDEFLRRDTAKMARRTSIAESLDRKRYPALVLLAKIYWVAGILGIMGIVLWVLLGVAAFLIARFAAPVDGRAPLSVVVQSELYFIVVLLLMIFQTIVCFSVAEIIKWAIDMKTGNTTTNSLLQELVEKLDR